MTVRRRGDDKQANGSANGSANGTANGSLKEDHDLELKTDHSRWRMQNIDGCQRWHYLESDEQLKAWPMTSADKYYLGQDTVRCKAISVVQDCILTA
jgi:lanosterol synthase